MASPKKVAKITQPLTRDVLLRQRLFTLLDEQRSAPVVWIYGPPGVGKTTLAASYCKYKQQPCLWYRVDKGDSDVATFYYYAKLAAINLLSTSANHLPSFTAESTDGFAAFARSFFRQLFAVLPEGAMLIFDNCHELDTQAPFFSVLNLAAKEITQGINLICISRHAPPPAFSKLQLYNQCREIGWQELRFTLDESRALVRRYQVNFPEPSLAWLHEKTRGWVSGLILLAKNGHPVGSVATLEPLPEASALFGYLASEVFDELAGDIREFLMRAALLPEMTATSAQQLTGYPGAQRVLNEMAAKGYFVECSAEADPVYQFHPLCREFLLARAQRNIEPQKLAVLRLEAAKLLEKLDNVELAIDLYRQLQCWQELKNLLLAKAEGLICCGRHRSLIQWLECLPASEITNDDVLCYWLGIAYIPVDTKYAYELLERAHQRFLAERNAEWSYRTWSAVVETICFARDDFGPLQRWIEHFSELRLQFPYFRSPELKAKVFSSAVLVMSILDTRNPWLIEIVRLSEYAVRLIPIELFQQTVLINLAYYYNFTGNLARFRVFAPKLKKALQNEKLPPAARILASVMLMLLAICGDEDDALEFYQAGVNLAEQSGVYLFNGLLYGYNIYHYALKGELATAWELLEQANEKTPPRFTHDFAHYSQISAWLAALEGDTDLALEHNAVALGLLQQLHYPFGAALTKDLSVQLLAKQGRWVEAQTQLDGERRIVDSLASKCLTHKLNCSLAWLSYLRKDEAELQKHLRNAFAIGRAENILAWYGLLPDVLHPLCAKALQFGIETEYAKQLIGIYKLVPEQPTSDLENWPWAHHFYALGQFTILADGQVLEYAGKAPLKALELLQVIIAYGGTQVDSLTIGTLLWPDSDGDNAQQALETALFRLRKLIGKDSINVSGGKISLNKKRCWLDVWAYEQALTQMEQMLSGPRILDDVLLERGLAALTRLYRGPLFGDFCPYWAEDIRSRQQNKYYKTLKKLSAYYQHAERDDKASYFLEKLAEVRIPM